MRYLLLLFSLFAINFQSFSQKKKEAINYDSAINKTVLINYFKEGTVTLNDNWKTTNKFIPHYLVLKNQHKDFIEIIISEKKDNQFYTTNTTDAELLSKDAEFEAKRHKAYSSLFEKIHDEKTCYFEKIYGDSICYVFNEYKNNMPGMTIVGIKNDYLIEITFRPKFKDRTKNLDYLLTLFTNLNIN
ncbi:hypothetical protein FEDK69T_14470 [Flavobacterium enshiense DK69]|uniref:Uncharacterized protein n=1 Tax=Flavobacterium enshiense DK69 TaxID=1107311 RepID=V6S9H6_9FLAO|nr:hypothetical protein [Flavobacterium enshiense]ESU23291.1 hypothetical protein FEDK69T_14470 [Flavobacterium enshiense DK69]KGO96478.1 hypothetical protein Q767_06125 [Flavobacterium enshiense DK69]